MVKEAPQPLGPPPESDVHPVAGQERLDRLRRVRAQLVPYQDQRPADAPPDVPQRGDHLSGVHRADDVPGVELGDLAITRGGERDQ